MYHIKNGLDLPINGKPSQKIEAGPSISKVGINGPDYVGMKPSMLVKVGDTVKAGQALFSCKKVEGVIYTSPVSGKVVEINRGDKRVFQNVIIEISGNDHVSFASFKSKSVKDLEKQDVVDLMVESGMWPSLRTRPFSKAPAITSEPKAIFITAMDTNPLACDPVVVIGENTQAFLDGSEIISKLTDGKTFICKAAGVSIPKPTTTKIELQEFAGVHPAGNAGTHIHFVSPVGPNKTVWHVGYQDVIAIGKLFATGKLSSERVISIAGPKAVNPSLVRTIVGAQLGEVTSGKIGSGEVRVVSGSVLNGRKMEGVYSFLGRFHNQISLLAEDREREFFGWHMPGLNKFSLKRTFLHWLKPGQTFNFTTKVHGSPRAMVPVGSFEQVMPLDILPTQLLRSLVTNDVDHAVELGCLELDEEDLALCTFASSGKEDFGPALRNILTTIEKEG